MSGVVLADMDGDYLVLHIDDEPGFAEMAAEFLERESDCLTVTAEMRPSEGLDRLADQDFDCIISDYDMPEQDGIEFLTTVREKYPDLPFILYTGKGSEEVASDAISAGATDYLQKEPGPSQYTVLANKVTNAVEQYRTQLDLRRRRSQRDRQSDALLELTTDDAVTAGDFDRAVERITETAAKVLDVPRVNIWLFDDDRDTLECVDHYDNESDTHASGMELDTEVYTTYSETLASNRVIVATDAIEDQRTAELNDYLEEHDVRALLDATIRAEGDVVGVVCHEHVGGPREWTEDEIEFATNIADLVHRALRNQERVQRRSKLERTNALLSTFIETLPVGILAENAEREVLAINERLIELLERSEPPAEIIGMDCDALAKDASAMFTDPEGFVDRISELVVDRESVQEEELTLKDGRTFTRTHEPIELPSGDGHLWVYRDVTTRIEREARLEELNKTSQELMTASSRTEVAEIGVKAARDILDLEANAVHLYDDEQSGLVPVAQTESSEELVGEPPTFTEGDSIAWRVYESGEALALDDIHADPDIYNRKTPVRSELYLPINDHGILLNASETSEAFDRQDVVLGELLASTMATAFDQIEGTEQLRIRERNLERQNKRLDEFASVVSHDLRNPLNVAEGRLELVQEECDSEQIEVIDRTLTRMDNLIDDLLTLARDGEEVSETEPVALSSLAENCWQNVETANAMLRTDASKTIHAHRSRLAQLLENLFRNAVEHGGPTVTISIGALTDGFYVEDDGLGIPEDDRDEVFNAGYSTTDDGTGFGLSIVKQVAEAHGWEIHMTAGSNGGARFEIRSVEFDAV